jgi:hypothetical protein
MFQIQIYEVPLLAIAIPIVLALVRYLMLYIGFRMMLRRAHPSDYPAVYRAYVHGLTQRGPRFAEVIKIIRPGPARTPDLWVRREPVGPRQDRTPVGR